MNPGIGFVSEPKRRVRREPSSWIRLRMEAEEIFSLGEKKMRKNTIKARSSRGSKKWELPGFAKERREAELLKSCSKFWKLTRLVQLVLFEPKSSSHNLHQTGSLKRN
ncbi:hypothetical protein SLEP1_g47162 [Rubroshorea leprosula]|uniref:Uncharacterized protein n=1 Tax=Rubroshorea leprosula TaxID=152421 RepID=A0AAV5LQH6_9ROSI|nr:hypothetical protein SLEP1_g47162 [Rubroshorea leprosula]